MASKRESMIRQVAAVGGLGLIGWAICGAAVFAGMAQWTMQTALVVHAAVAPLVFAVLAWINFRWFDHASPLWTAAIFLGIVIFMDVFVVAMLIEKSFEMFASILGTWFPWLLIFLAAWTTGTLLHRRVRQD